MGSVEIAPRSTQASSSGGEAAGKGPVCGSGEGGLVDVSAGLQRLEAEAVAVERGARGCLGQQQEHLQHARPDGGALSVGGQLAW